MKLGQLFNEEDIFNMDDIIDTKKGKSAINVIKSEADLIGYHNITSTFSIDFTYYTPNLVETAYGSLSSGTGFNDFRDENIVVRIIIPLSEFYNIKFTEAIRFMLLNSDLNLLNPLNKDILRDKFRGPNILQFFQFREPNMIQFLRNKLTQIDIIKHNIASSVVKNSVILPHVELAHSCDIVNLVVTPKDEENYSLFTILNSYNKEARKSMKYYATFYSVRTHTGPTGVTYHYRPSGSPVLSQGSVTSVSFEKGVIEAFIKDKLHSIDKYNDLIKK